MSSMVSANSAASFASFRSIGESTWGEMESVNSEDFQMDGMFLYIIETGN